MTLKIEGANSEVSSKIKSAESKLLAKGKHKMPHAKEFKVKMRPSPVKASSGSFYGGHLYGTEDGVKWIKCAEVRIREGKESVAPSPKPAVGEKPRVEEPKDLKGELIHEIERALSHLPFHIKRGEVLSFAKSRINDVVKMKVQFTASVENTPGSWDDKTMGLKQNIHRALALGGSLPRWKVTARDFNMPKLQPKESSFRFSFELVLAGR